MFALTISAVVCLTIFGSRVDAIRCHQCNSHLEEDCIQLALMTPRAPRDDHYLKECEETETICRKTMFLIGATSEKRIVRGCGKIENDWDHPKDICFTANSEALKQTICSCHEDGCNAAPSYLVRGNPLLMFVLGGVCIALATLLRQSN